MQRLPWGWAGTCCSLLQQKVPWDLDPAVARAPVRLRGFILLQLSSPGALLLAQEVAKNSREHLWPWKEEQKQSRAGSQRAAKQQQVRAAAQGPLLAAAQRHRTEAALELLPRAGQGPMQAAAWWCISIQLSSWSPERPRGRGRRSSSSRG